MNLKHAIGQIDLTAVLCIVMAPIAFFLPGVMTLLWLAVAVFAQLGVWDRVKTIMYAQLSSRDNRELGLKVLQSGEKRY